MGNTSLNSLSPSPLQIVLRTHVIGSYSLYHNQGRIIIIIVLGPIDCMRSRAEVGNVERVKVEVLL